LLSFPEASAFACGDRRASLISKMSIPQGVRALGRVALAIVPLGLIWSLAISPSPAMPVRAVIVAVSLLALISPAEALIVVALMTPMGDLIGIGMDASIRIAEAVVVAFFAGWLLRPVLNHKSGPSPTLPVRYSAWGLAAIILASIAVQALHLRRTTPAAWMGASSVLEHAYFNVTGSDPIGAINGARLVEGLALSAAVVVLLRKKPMLAVWLPEALGAGCAAAAVASLLLWRGMAFPAVLARHALIGDRVVAHVGDLNAAGSYFALLLCLAAGMAVRERSSKRIGWSAVTASALIGLWLCVSRSATAAALLAIATAASWSMTRRWSRQHRYRLLALVVIAIAVVSFALERQREQDPTYRGTGFRIQFAETSYRMIRARPWFGIGIGQYYPTSPLFFTPPLASAYGAENAHDYFLQLAAEVGMVGFAACAILLAGTAWLVARTLAGAPDDYRLLGLAAGVAAFLLTCVTGHPLLVSEVAYSFWIAAGLLLVLSSPVRVDIGVGRAFEGMTPKRAAFAAGLLLLAVSIPIRAREPLPGMTRTRAIDGLYEWEKGKDGRRYRRTDEYASVFVEGNPRWAEIPMRAPIEDHGATPVGVEISVEGNRGQRWLIGNEWTPVRIQLPPSKSPTLSVRRINIKTDRPRSATEQAAGNTRAVGVQIGESVVPAG
jgi:O-antigen ligase